MTSNICIQIVYKYPHQKRFFFKDVPSLNFNSNIHAQRLYNIKLDVFQLGILNEWPYVYTKYSYKPVLAIQMLPNSFAIGTY